MDGGIVWIFLIVGWIIWNVIKSLNNESEAKQQLETFVSDNKFKSQSTFKNGPRPPIITTINESKRGSKPIK